MPKGQNIPIPPDDHPFRVEWGISQERKLEEVQKRRKAMLRKFREENAKRV